MIYHASLLTEYAAFQAVRAGIVYRAEGAKMERAACLSIVPTLAGAIYGRTADDVRLATPIGGWEGLAQAFCGEEGRNPQQEIFGLPLVRVAAAGPAPGDFDDPGRTAADRRLSARVTYLYPMHIPFVNRLIQMAALARR